MGMELMLDYEDLEEQLSKVDDPDKKTWFNEALWRAIAVLALIFALSYVPSTVYYTGWGTGWMGLGWNFNYNIYLQLMLGSMIPILVVGLKVEAGQKKYFSKLKLMKSYEAKISEKDEEIAAIKVKLNDACATIEANKVALGKAEGK